MSPFSDRPTADVVMIVIVIAVGASLLIAGAGLVTLAIVHPEQEVDRALTTYAHTLSLLVGVLAGYLAGKRTGGQ